MTTEVRIAEAYLDRTMSCAQVHAQLSRWTVGSKLHRMAERGRGRVRVPLQHTWDDNRIVGRTTIYVEKAPLTSQEVVQLVCTCIRLHQAQ